MEKWLDKYQDGGEVDAISGAAPKKWQIPIKEREDFKGNFLSYQGSGHKRRDAWGSLGDLYRYYGGDKLENEVLYHSKYKPSTAKNPNAEYISIKDSNFMSSIIEEANRVFVDKKLHPISDETINNNTMGISGYMSKYRNSGNLGAIGRFFVSKGKDNDGEYISYYDVFDTNSGQQKGRALSEKIGATKPFELYDRIYVDQDSTGRYIPREEFKSGGILTSSKAKEILRDNTAHGYPLTPKQKRYMGWVAGGKKAENGGWLDKYLNGGQLKKSNQLRTFTNGWMDKYL